jgi:CheY-like chemotaxis protein
MARLAVTAAALVSGEDLAVLSRRDGGEGSGGEGAPERGGPDGPPRPERLRLEARLARFAARAGLASANVLRVGKGGRQIVVAASGGAAARDPAAASGRTGAVLAWAYAPILREDGRVDAVAGVELNLGSLREEGARLRLLGPVQAAALLAAAVLWLAPALAARAAARRAGADLRMKTACLERLRRELRAPAEALEELADLARRGLEEGDAAGRLEAVARAGAGLVAAAEDLLDRMPEGGRGAEGPGPSSYWTAGLLEEAAGVARLLIGDRPVELEVAAPAALPSRLAGDRAGVARILHALLRNAVRHTPDGRIRLEAYALPPGRWGWLALTRPTCCAGFYPPWGGRGRGPGELAGGGADGRIRLVFRVEDTGAAIRPADLRRIFRRGTPAAGPARAGAILGLPEARGLARAMGGDIKATSAPWKGSVFTAEVIQEVRDRSPMGGLSLPAPAGPRGTSPASFTAPGTSVLVVDDLITSLVVAEGLLEPYRMRVRTASGGAEALRALEEGDFDLVLLDHMMPGMDGEETVQIIRAMGGGRLASLPVVAFTANTVPGMREYFLGNGFDDYVAKPVDPAELDRVLARLIPEPRKGPPPPAARAPGGGHCLT